MREPGRAALLRVDAPGRDARATSGRGSRGASLPAAEKVRSKGKGLLQPKVSSGARRKACGDAPVARGTGGSPHGRVRQHGRPTEPISGPALRRRALLGRGEMRGGA